MKPYRQDYTLGFAFSEDRQHVVLIEKEKPQWQKGFLNGVGGKFEFEIDHSLHSCMVREFKEETNVLIESWWDVCTMYNDDFKVCVFSTFTNDIYSCISNEDEKVTILPVSAVNNFKILYNLSWLIPMALDDQIINEEDGNHYMVSSQ